MPPKIPTLPPTPDLERALATGMEFTEMRRSQAKALVRDLVAQGHVARDQMSAAVDEVLELSRRRSDDLRKVVQGEVQRQLGALGLATKADLVALERKVARAGAGNSPAAKQAPGKKAPSKHTAAKKTPAKKAGAKKTAAKKTPAKKPAAKKAG